MTDLVFIASQVGDRVAREFPGIESEDVAQEVIARIFENHNFPEAFDPDYLYMAMYKEGKAYALKERYDYILSTSQYLYRPDEVRALLEEVYFQPSSQDVPTAKDDRVSADISSGTVFASLLDIQEAWKKIPRNHSDILLRKYADGEAIEDTKAVTRAIDALTRAMNIHINRSGDEHVGPGSRRAMSNAESQFATRNQG